MGGFKLEGSITLYGKVFGKYVKANITTKDIENLKQERDDLLEALQELVELKQMKLMEGEYPSEEYLKRKPLAWDKAKQAIENTLK